MIWLPGSTSGRIQSQAGACLLEVAASASGDEGCATASIEEIDVLLGALQNPKSVIRDAALRALFLMRSSIPTITESYEDALRINKRIWVARFDVIEENK